MATFFGVVVNGPVGFGGVLTVPPLQPLILAQAPKATAAELRLSTAFSTAFMQWQATVKPSGMPLWPSFAAFPGPVAPPTPSIPVPNLLATGPVPTFSPPAVPAGPVVGGTALGSPGIFT